MIEADTSELLEKVKRLEKAAKNAPLEIKRVLISVRRATKSFAIRKTLARYNVARKSVEKRTAVNNPDFNGFTLSANDTPISLASFGAEQLGSENIGPGTRGYGTGVSVKVLKRGSATTLDKRAFIARAKPSPNTDERANLVYERRKTPGKRGGKLRALYGPSVGALHKNPEFQKELAEFFTERAGRVVAQRLARVMVANGK